jgi:hypothetical protein
MLNTLEIDLTQGGYPSGDQEQLSIHYSNKILDFLKSKVSSHNRKPEIKKTNIQQIKDIFCAAFKERCEEDKLAYAIARVDAFLKIKSEGFSKKFFDENLNLKVSEESLAVSKLEAKESGLEDFPFKSLEDLYIDEDYKTSISFDY